MIGGVAAVKTKCHVLVMTLKYFFERVLSPIIINRAMVLKMEHLHIQPSMSNMYVPYLKWTLLVASTDKA